MLRILKYTGLGLLGLIALVLLLPYLFPGVVTEKVKAWANRSINAELDFKKPRLSFFEHFPSLTLTLHDLTLKGSKPFGQDTLLHTEALSFGFDLSSVLSRKLRINEIYLSNGVVKILSDTLGRPNYNVYTPNDQQPTTNNQSSTDLKIEHVQLEDMQLIYDDRALDVRVDARDVNLTGEGDMAREKFALKTELGIGSLDLSYAGENWLRDKKVELDLLTQVDTKNLSFQLERTDMKVNSLPLQLNGLFSFLNNGYRMDLHLRSKDAGLDDLLNAFPPEMMDWVNKTKASGRFELDARLKGDYVADQRMPDMHMTCALMGGKLSHDGAPLPLSDILLRAELDAPSLEPDSMHVRMDTLSFKLGQDMFFATASMIGLQNPLVNGRVDTELDLTGWQQAVGPLGMTIGGRLVLHATANGRYVKTGNTIKSIPAFTVLSTLRKGSYKQKGMEIPVEDIWLDLNASCADNDYRHTAISLDSLHARLLGNALHGHLHLRNMGHTPMDAALHTVLDLHDIDKVHPMQGMELGGNLKIDLDSRGVLWPEKKRWPITRVDMKMDNGSIRTPYYPKPVERIAIDATLSNRTPDLRSTDIDLRPVSFLFEGRPFMLKADVKNLDDIRYDINSDGTIDLGNLAKVFALDQYGLGGTIESHLVMRGSQKDAEAQRYDRLYNKGSLRLRDVSFRTSTLPLPVRINRGDFHFEQDNMVFDAFKATYGKSDISLDGKLEHLIAWVTEAGAPLQGHFGLRSDRLVLDEFRSVSEPVPSPAKPASPPSSGVLLLPKDVDMQVDATVKQASYEGLILQDVKGGIGLQKGKAMLHDLSFNTIGTNVNMSGAYEGIGPKKAVFDYKIKAVDFDVKKAYKQVDLFRDLVPAAAYAEGTISLDYSISGKLDQNMDPIMPSLKGEGMLSVKKVKLKGFKLMNSLGSHTGKDALRDPDLSKVDIRSRIENNLLTIERVKMKVAGFRPRFEGQVGLDGKLFLKGRVGLPPFGIFGIPFTVTGTQSDPKVQVRRSKEGDKLEETREDPEED